MSRDFKIGLICGLVLAIAALFWVATRPSLTSQARMFGPTPTSSRDDGPLTQPVDRRERRPSPRPGLVPAEPDMATHAAASTPVQPAPDVTQPNLPDLTIYEQPEKIKTTKFHIVRRGESLSSISQQHYGSASKWQKILEANRDRIRDADKITPGTKLIIPD